jgi:hypothetical protein
MKKSLFILLLCRLSSLSAQGDFTNALEAFHTTLAFTYHPMVDDSNFSPIRNRVSELSANAEKVEETLDSFTHSDKQLENAVEQLAEQCRALKDVIIKGAKDEIIRMRLTDIHEKFHEIERMKSEIEEKE